MSSRITRVGDPSASWRHSDSDTPERQAIRNALDTSARETLLHAVNAVEAEERISKFWSEFNTLFRKEDYGGLFELAQRYKPFIKNKIQFTDVIERLFLEDKPIRSKGFDRIRRIATLDEILNPTSTYPRLIIALCHFKAGHELSAYTIVNHGLKRAKELRSWQVFYKYSQPLISKYLGELLESYKITRARIVKKPETFYKLRV